MSESTSSISRQAQDTSAAGGGGLRDASRLGPTEVLESRLRPAGDDERAAVARWLSAFDASLAARDREALEALFVADGYWRNLSGISWPIVTFEGAPTIARELAARAPTNSPRGFAPDPARLDARLNDLLGRQVVEAAFAFDTEGGRGEGVVRLVEEDGSWRAWTLSTGLDMDARTLRPGDAGGGHSHARDFGEPGWPEARRRACAFEDREPTVLVIGGGHAGLSVAAECQALGLDTLVVDKMARIGDNWRLRYNGLKLHNRTPVNHMRHLPFPSTWPAYIPKDKIANWLEAYVETLEVNFWTKTTFLGATYDDSAAEWHANVRRADGSERTLRPKHIVMATSVSSKPNVPTIDTIEAFEGPVLHSSQFEAGAEWSGKPVVVFGTGTSAHDISQELHANGAHVTMVQRNPTLIINVDPSAQLYDRIYLGEGPPMAVRDLINASYPFPLVKEIHKELTAIVREIDADLLERLEAVGFKLDFGEDGTGWPLKYRQRGGGYYFNVGCSELIADREVALIQADDIDTFVADGIRMADGRHVPAELVVLATGYQGPSAMLSELFGEAVRERVGKVWGIDPNTHELNNMWTRTPQPGLWFVGGAFSQARLFTRYLAMQIEAIEAGRFAKSLEGERPAAAA